MKNNVLLVIGNGFDLQCGLDTNYSDFFAKRYGINLKDKVEKENYQNWIINKIENFSIKEDGSKSNGWGKNYFYHQGLKEEYPDTKNSIKKITNWDIIFLILFGTIDESVSGIQWNDIEEVIYEVVTIFFKKDTEHLHLKFKSKELQKQVEKIIQYLFQETRGNEDSILSDLHDFEKEFGLYIKDEVEGNEVYYNSASNLIKTLVGETNATNVDILNFNYSLDKEFMDGFNKENTLITIHTWNNIHGIANWNSKRMGKKLSAPIFGIDSHDILSKESDKILNYDDQRIIFTKSYRLIENEVNNMREEPFLSNIDKIIFYGHSLNHADYSYFESIFDMYNIFDKESNVELEFYYPKFNEKEGIDDRKVRRNTLKNMVNLLTSYGETLGEGKHGENIVNRLVLEQRLNMIPGPPSPVIKK